MPNWSEVYREIGQLQANHKAQSERAIDITRQKYLKALSEKLNRNVIAYYSAFTQKGGVSGSEVNDDDKNGFMMAVHQLPREKGLDLIIHTQGGSIAAAESLVNYLRKIFKTDIRAIVPGIAMSAGTMIALCSKSIYMGKHSNLGPIDPHLGSLPALGIIEEFRRAHREIKKDPSKFAVWNPILSKYQPSMISQCENAVAWSKEFVRRELLHSMLSGEKDKEKIAKRIVNSLTNYKGNRRHERHIHAEECKKLGIKILDIEADPEIQDAILTAHHCFIHTLSNTLAIKIIENHNGTNFTKMLPQPSRY